MAPLLVRSANLGTTTCVGHRTDNIKCFNKSTKVYPCRNHDSNMEYLMAGTPYIELIPCPPFRNLDGVSKSLGNYAVEQVLP